MVLAKRNLIPRPNLSVDIHLGVHDQVELLEGLLLQYCHINRRHSFPLKLSCSLRVQVLDNGIVVEVLQSLIDELLARLSLNSGLLPHMLLKCVSMGAHFVVLNRQPVLYDIFHMPVMFLKLSVDTVGLGVRRW